MKSTFKKLLNKKWIGQNKKIEINKKEYKYNIIADIEKEKIKNENCQMTTDK